MLRGGEGNCVVCSDNLIIMQNLPAGCCSLIYADPPFDVGGPFGKAFTSPRSADRKGEKGLAGYLAFLRPRLEQMHRLLAASGCLYLHLDWRRVHYARVLLDEIFGPDNFLNEIIWVYRSGARPGRWFARKHDTLLLYARHAGEHIFNRPREGAYRTRDLRMSDDGRPYKSTRKGPLFFHPDGPAMSDVWEVPFLSTVSKERTGYPTQKPEKLLERIVLASSNEDDLVADFFCGSGTTLVVAKRLNRHCIGCDISPEAVAITKRRLGRS